jgi:dTDP-L-rhamnose 4-epimerase
MGLEHGARVLLTGGAGFLGRSLAQLLVASGTPVRALDSLNPRVHRFPDRSGADLAGQLGVGDVRDRDAVAAAARGCAAIVHLAAEIGAGVPGDAVERYFSVNVDGTRTVLDVAMQSRRPVLLVSSRVVYGRGAYRCPAHGRVTGQRCCGRGLPTPSRETDPATPISVYGESKAQAERIAAGYAARGLTVVTVRPQTLIGPGQRPDDPYTAPLAAFVHEARQGLPPRVPAPGTQARDLLDVDDAARAIQWLLMHRHAWKDAAVLNLGTGAPVSLRKLALLTSTAAGGAGIELVPARERDDIPYACADTSLARSLGLPAPRLSLVDSLRRMLTRDPAPAGPHLASLGLRRP